MSKAIDYLNALKRRTCTVTFTTKEGLTRTIRGYALEGDQLRNATAVPIRELGTGEFKSFRADSVIDFRYAPVTSFEVPL